MRSEAPLLDVANLSIRIGDADRNLVDDVSFSVAAGETLCIVGESGCGKSLTALALMGLLATPPVRITGGKIVFGGRDLLTLSQNELSELRGDGIAMIFQEPMTALNPAFTIGDQIAEAVMRHRKADKPEARRRALEMLERVGIPAAETRLAAYPHQLSGGMRQRAMIAMALANDPVLLIADEPTTALDVTIQAQVLKLIRDLQKESGTGLVLITHDLGVVAEIADKVAVMYAGRIVEDGSTGAVLEHPRHPYMMGLTNAFPDLEGAANELVPIDGSPPDLASPPAGCRFQPRCPFALERCAVDDPVTLRDADGAAIACHRANEAEALRPRARETATWLPA